MGGEDVRMFTSVKGHCLVLRKISLTHFQPCFIVFILGCVGSPLLRGLSLVAVRSLTVVASPVAEKL